MSDYLKLVPLGGLGEIGKNMMAIEYGQEIIVIDAGIMFPENDMLGIDFIIPDYTYLKDKRDRIKAMLITHGHEDHVGALPHFLADINVPVYGTPLTMGLVEVKLRQAKLLPHVKLNVIEAGSTFHIGSFKIEPFHVAHSIPDCVGFGITTPVGLIVHTGDYKFDHTPLDGWPPDFGKLAEFSTRGVLALLADSTNATRPGWTPSERVIEEGIDKVFREAHGRIIVTTFASLISRIQLVANLCIKYNRKLAVTGRSMRDNTRMAMRMGYLDIPDGLLIDIDQAGKHPDDRVAIMATGSQGEPTAVLGRLANGRHRHFRIKEGDTVVLSAHPIPGNEEMVYRIINRLIQRGAIVLYDSIAQVHVSGHASQEEMKLMINLVKPKFFIPVHGELRLLKHHALIARDLGIPEKHIAVVENGTPIRLYQNKIVLEERMSGGYIFVDGSSVGETGWSMVREREQLAQNGFLVVSVHLNDSGQLVTDPTFVSEGFMNLKGAHELLEGASEVIESVAKMHIRNEGQLHNQISSALTRYIYTETGRRPTVHTIVHF